MKCLSDNCNGYIELFNFLKLLNWLANVGPDTAVCSEEGVVTPWETTSSSVRTAIPEWKEDCLPGLL